MSSHDLASRVAVCTLFEGNYHFGVGALFNSLYRQGFRGTLWAGYRGELPPWAHPSDTNGSHTDFAAAPNGLIRFVRVQTERHLTNYKPIWMLDILARDPALTGLAYFDPDITIRCEWSFYIQWIEMGIALVQDITNGWMPSDHPIRLQWVRLAEKAGYSVRRAPAQYFNGGFVGVDRRFSSCLELWRGLLDLLSGAGTDLSRFNMADRAHPFSAFDQDTLNLMTMLTEHPLSTIGPEGMDFVPGGFTMTHSVGHPKPWNKRMIVSALDGRRPTPSDHEFLRHADAPIPLLSPSGIFWKKLDLRIAVALGRLWNRA